MTRNSTRHVIAGLLALVIVLSVPFLAYAQSSNAELRAGIRAEIVKDPRTSSMSEAEIDAMVEALTAGAEAEGIESGSFSAQPSSFAPTAEPEASACGSMPAFLCRINQTLGFDGSNALIPIALLAISGLLAFLLWELKRHSLTHGHEPLQ
jgi:hypothetical protein